MSDISVRRLTNPTEQELDKATTVVAEAFNHEFFPYALGDRAYVQPIIRSHFTAATVAGGNLYVAELPGEGIVGVSGWFGPGQKFLLTPEQRDAGWNQVMEKIPLNYQAWWTHFFDSYRQDDETIYGPGVKLGAYHLQILGTSPAHQRKGIAGALIRHVQAKAAKENLPTVIETRSEKSVCFYKSFGYNEAGKGVYEKPSGEKFDMSFLIKYP